MWQWALIGVGAFVLVTGVLLIFFTRRVTWWEYILPIPLTFIIAFVSSCIDTSVQTTDYQYCTGWLTEAQYDEDWDEMVTVVYTETDSKGRTRTKTRREHRYHGPQWRVQNNYGAWSSISRTEYESLVKKWGNSTFFDLHRAYHLNDGDRYITKFPGGDELMVVTTFSKSYENKTQAVPGAFNYNEKIDTSMFNVAAYPSTSTVEGCPSVLGDATSEEVRAVNLLNAKNCPSKDIRVWVIIFQNQPMEAAFQQESLWRGGNRNELVVCVGIDAERKPLWTRAFGWTRVEQLKAEASDYLLHQPKLNLVEYAKWLEPQINKSWAAADMSEYNYIIVPPSTTALIIGFIIILLCNAALSVWLIMNEFHDDHCHWRWN